MNSKLKIILIVGVVVLLCGVGVSAAGYAMGGMKGVIMEASGPQVIDESYKTKIVKVDESFDNVTAIDINLDGIEKVTIKEGPSVTAKGEQFLAFGGLKAERGADGTLAVTHSVEHKGPHWTIDFPSIFRAAVGPYPSSYLDITVPRGTSLAAITVDLAFGGVTIDAAVADRAEIKVDSGSISASDITSESFKVDSSFGDIDLQNINAGDVVIASDSGSIKLWNLTVPGDLTLKSSFGKVDLDAVNAGTSKFDMSSGDFSARGISVANGMELNSSYGDIELSGSLRGYSAINSDSGNLDMELNGTEDDYEISTESDAGDVRIGDRGFGNYGHGRFESGPSSAPNKISINSSFGGVDVEFRG
jgi:hypothetical protein